MSLMQLKNINHTFDVGVGDVGVTIRKGSKWYDVRECDEFELRICPKAHDGVCNSLCKLVGLGKKIGNWKGTLKELPNALLKIEHNKKCRNREVLRQMLEVAYKDVGNDTIVTALIYIRVK